jgi:hypothetical protein
MSASVLVTSSRTIVGSIARSCARIAFVLVPVVVRVLVVLVVVPRRPVALVLRHP